MMHLSLSPSMPYVGQEGTRPSRPSHRFRMKVHEATKVSVKECSTGFYCNFSRDAGCFYSPDLKRFHISKARNIWGKNLFESKPSILMGLKCPVFVKFLEALKLSLPTHFSVQLIWQIFRILSNSLSNWCQMPRWGGKLDTSFDLRVCEAGGCMTLATSASIRLRHESHTGRNNVICLAERYWCHTDRGTPHWDHSGCFRRWKNSLELFEACLRPLNHVLLQFLGSLFENTKGWGIFGPHQAVGQTLQKPAVAPGWDTRDFAHGSGSRIYPEIHGSFFNSFSMSIFKTTTRIYM